jgi:hypothetical protein
MNRNETSYTAETQRLEERNEQIKLSAEVREALSSAAEWYLIGMLFERPGRHRLDQLQVVSTEIVDPQLQEAARDLLVLTEETYLQLFGPGGAVSPREVAYIGWQDPGKILAQLEMLYESFSYRPRREDPVDHVAVEAGFVSYLYIKEAYSQVSANSDAGSVTNDVRKKFIEEHFGLLVQGLHQKLTGGPFSKLLDAMVSRLQGFGFTKPIDAFDDLSPEAPTCRLPEFEIDGI